MKFVRAIRNTALWLAMAGIAAATLAESERPGRGARPQSKGNSSAVAARSVSVVGVASGESAARKFARIESGRVAPGSRIDFTPGELNSWTLEEARTLVPQGVRNVRLELSGGRVNGYADIDFLKLRQAATGEAPGWMMRNLLAGERPVVVTARIQSRNGRARVDVQRVEISGVSIEGRMLDLLIENYVHPTFPDARVSEWFDLKYQVDHFTVSPSGVSVFVGGKMVAFTGPGSG
jgi:hypothetical protein